MTKFKVGDRVMIAADAGQGLVVAYASRGTLYRVYSYETKKVHDFHPSWLTPLDGDEETEDAPDNDPVHHPAHYSSLGATCKGCGKEIECIDVVQHMNYSLGNVTKYVWRVDDKGDPIENLKKARQYLDFEIARREREKK